MAADSTQPNVVPLQQTPPMEEPPPPTDADAASAAGGGGGQAGGSAARTPSKRREKRKPVINTGALVTLHRDFAYQYGTEVAWDCVRKVPIRISHLRHTFGHDAVKMWMASEKRRVVYEDQVVFDPAERCPPSWVNLFHGWGVEPASGATAPFHAVLAHLCGHDEAVVDFVLNWYAWPLQHPGAKMPSAVVMHGAEGTGKNLVNEAIATIHGRHGKVVGQRELESQWNDWLSGCTFVIGDEVVSRQEMRHHKGVLKALITGTDVNIATKFMNLRKERNCMNMVFLSNEVEPLKLDPSDRRYLVIWTQAPAEKQLYADFVAWRDAGGIAALFAELLARDLSGWHPHAPPPPTGAKRDLIDLGRLSPERFWRDWQAAEIANLPHHSCSADQAYRAYTRWCRAEGERYPLTKPHFSRLVQREAGGDLQVKACKLGRGNTTARMWLVAPPPDGVTFADWAQDAVEAFEGHLRRFGIGDGQEGGG